MSMTWTPRVSYGTGPTVLAFSAPMTPWEPWNETTGGDEEAASGVVEAFEIRHDEGREFYLRFYEDELEDVMAFLRWARTSGQAFSFRFAASDPATEADVLLVYPRIRDGRVAPARSAAYPWLFEQRIAIRTEDGEPFPGTWGSPPVGGS